jgi:glycosyltransferase involved in cell wall biosynthesis
MKPLVVAVVLPSLNEEVALRNTCKSLGFLKPPIHSVSRTFLFIVDNGSTDGTVEVARKIQHEAHSSAVFIGQEKERGYVPPRHTGNTLVKAFAEHNGLDLSEVLVLQADADTAYGEGYIERMRSASQSFGPNLLLEGLAEFPQIFRDSFAEYVKLSSEIDSRVLAVLKMPETSNVVCTDAVCGYRLSDYFAWGSHLREYRNDGSEIHAETTRLYMRALARGARKIYVEALAYPSERKIISRPVEELATAGFPRESSWKASWERQFHNSISLDDFHAHLKHPTILHAIHLRERHLIALFGILPLHVARAIGKTLPIPAKKALSDIATSLPKHDRETLYKHPGVLLTEVLNLVDRHGPALSDLLVGKCDTE